MSNVTVAADEPGQAWDIEAQASLSRTALGRLLRRPSFLLAAFIVVLMIVIAAVPQAFAGWFGHGDPRACDLVNSAIGPSSGHPFGFDKQGCDVYANVIYGTRDSISIGLLASVFGLRARGDPRFGVGLLPRRGGRDREPAVGRLLRLSVPARRVGVAHCVARAHNVWTVSLAIALVHAGPRSPG